MNVLINKSKAAGKITAPPSKSMAHRLLICSGLAGGGQVSNLAYSKDIEATRNCLDGLTKNEDTLFCNESGSTLRFILPICMLCGRKITVKGSERLFQRDLSVYREICQKQGILFEQGRDFVTVQGRLQSGEYKIRGDISSQFVSGLLFALPLLDKPSEIVLTTNLESRPYVDLTLKALELFGVNIEQKPDRFIIKGGQKYTKNDVSVEGDYSNAAFFDAFNCIGGQVEVEGLDKDSLQGDKIYGEYFRLLQKGTPTLDVSDCPDLAPVLMALAAAKNGCTLTGTHRLKIKESDRAEVMARELAKFGVCCKIGQNEVAVGCGISQPQETLCGHNDHRIVMALTVLCSMTGGKIEGAEAVSKSLPDFFDRIVGLGIEVELSET